MTTIASDDSVGPADQEVRRPDELEHWLTDIRVNLSEDTQAWLRPVGDTGHPADEPSIVALPTEDTERGSRTAASSTDPSRSLDTDLPRPAVGRHRAED
jgi:hypothetical protein